MAEVAVRPETAAPRAANGRSLIASPRGAVVFVVLCLAACGGSGPSTPTTPPTPSPSPTVPAAPLSRNGFFDATVVVDAQAPQTPLPEIQRVFARVATIFMEKTREPFRMTQAVYGMARGGSVDALARAYAATAAADPPDGLAVLTNDANAVTFGGYSFWLTPPYSFRNEFPSPRTGVGETALYVAVIDFDHAYARCGYDDQGNRVSDVAVNGECRNRPGTPCVPRPSGRAEWTCSGAENDLYSDHDYFTASTVVHEFLHPFGIDANANLDHYGTPACIARTGMTSAQAGDLLLAQQNCGLCPDVFARFRRRS